MSSVAQTQRIHSRRRTNHGSSSLLKPPNFYNIKSECAQRNKFAAEGEWFLFTPNSLSIDLYRRDKIELYFVRINGNGNSDEFCAVRGSFDRTHCILFVSSVLFIADGCCFIFHLNFSLKRATATQTHIFMKLRHMFIDFIHKLLHACSSIRNQVRLAPFWSSSILLLARIEKGQ